jgi:glycosyltransferase involved in cell wall biosynthesis
VVDALADLPDLRLVVAGNGPMLAELEARATANVEFVVDPSAETLRTLYRRAVLVVHAGYEDFGITMAEAQACGTPVVAARGGGALDIVAEGETGSFFDEQTASSVREAIAAAADEEWDAAAIAASAARFSEQEFRAAMSGIVSRVVLETAAGKVV